MLTSLFALMLFSTAAAAQQRCDLRVHVVDASTGKPLPKMYVNLRFGTNEGRKTVQQQTDPSGTTCFAMQQPVAPWTSVDAFSMRYLSTHADPLIRHLPDEVTIRMRHLSWMESLRYVLEGD